eukprot:CAMPEP_0172485550 /NCGR_PEP_ID=MMETSP1066-20121228/13615_1 /TAXON_ID=671091 /ORGANISM="Coscinodiscus wailesii, Strain CCMP2513" /LENGTH=241 /DNA_ID=CAMNT_0013250873 /DNA_START=184 /DNA_END=906 /DNA_ORIENTATION=+
MTSHDPSDPSNPSDPKQHVHSPQPTPAHNTDLPCLAAISDSELAPFKSAALLEPQPLTSVDMTINDRNLFSLLPDFYSTGLIGSTANHLAKVNSAKSMDDFDDDFPILSLTANVLETMTNGFDGTCPPNQAPENIPKNANPGLNCDVTQTNPDPDTIRPCLSLAPDTPSFAHNKHNVPTLTDELAPPTTFPLLLTPSTTQESSFNFGDEPESPYALQDLIFTITGTTNTQQFTLLSTNLNW